MPSGENEKSRANLEKGRNHRFSGENAVEMARRSHAKREENKDIARMLLARSEADFKKVADMIFKRAATGNEKYTELFLKLVGQMPADQLEATVTADNPLTALSPEELKEIYYGGKKD